MTDIWVKHLKGGLDSRRLPETSPGGTLIVAQDGHINRGGEFETRLAFVETAALPAGTYGLARSKAQLTVFGADAAIVGMPLNIAYQQLIHPLDSAIRLRKILSTELFAKKIYAIGQFQDGSIWHFYDGAAVAQWADMRARASIKILGGLAGGYIESLTVNSIETLGAAIPWVSDPNVMAANLAAEIMRFTSDPEYEAFVEGDTVYVISTADGAGVNGYVFDGTFVDVAVTLSGSMAGGVTDAAKYQSGKFVKTGNKKLFVISGSRAHFSKLQDPTEWFSGTGAGFIDMSDEATNFSDLTAISKYQDRYVFFSERTAQIWYNDPDPALNKQTQTLENTGTDSPKSVVKYGDNDVIYLDASGVRSARARDASNSAITNDLGVPVDTLILSDLESMSRLDRFDICGALEPNTGRYWLAIRSTIYVFTSYPGSQVAAWSIYKPGFEVDELVVFNRRVYVRAGDKIYCYGGETDIPTYADDAGEVWLPYLDGDSPSVKKTFAGIDIACRGDWEVRVALDPENLGTSDKVAIITGSTFVGPNIDGVGQGSHISLRFKAIGAGKHTLGSAIIHVQQGEKDKE